MTRPYESSEFITPAVFRLTGVGVEMKATGQRSMGQFGG